MTIFLHIFPRENMKTLYLLTSIGWPEKSMNDSKLSSHRDNIFGFIPPCRIAFKRILGSIFFLGQALGKYATLVLFKSNPQMGDTNSNVLFR